MKFNVKMNKNVHNRTILKINNYSKFVHLRKFCDGEICCKRIKLFYFSNKTSSIIDYLKIKILKLYNSYDKVYNVTYMSEMINFMEINKNKSSLTLTFGFPP